jgi:hypothetical protein
MKKIILGLVAATAVVAPIAIAGTANAAPSPKANQQTCFSGTSEGTTYGGTCVRNGASNFTLNTNDGNPSGSYAGVYVPVQNLAGTPTDNLALSFKYSGDTAGGFPRFSIPLVGGGYLFVDVAADANHDGVISTTEPGAIVSSPGYYGPMSGVHKVVAEGNTFIVADGFAGAVTVSDITLGRVAPGKITK